MTRPSTAIARISPGWTVSSPKRRPLNSSIIGRKRTVRPNPAPTPTTAPTPPSTAPPASTTARTWPRVPPHEPTRPSCRRDRRAPTAKAGPASRTISSRAIAATVRTAAVSSVSLPVQPRAYTAMGTSESGGGSRATWRARTTTPFSLAARMSGQVTPAPGGPWTSHFTPLAWGGRIFPSPSAVFCQGAMTAPGTANRDSFFSSAGSSTAPVRVYSCSGPRTVTRSPTESPAALRKAPVAAISSLAIG